MAFVSLLSCLSVRVLLNFIFNFFSSVCLREVSNFQCTRVWWGFVTVSPPRKWNSFFLLNDTGVKYAWKTLFELFLPFPSNKKNRTIKLNRRKVIKIVQRSVLWLRIADYKRRKLKGNRIQKSKAEKKIFDWVYGCRIADMSTSEFFQGFPRSRFTVYAVLLSLSFMVWDLRFVVVKFVSKN